MNRTPLFGAALCAIAVTHAQADDLSIETLAPPGPWLVVNVPDLAGTWDAFKGSDLGALWDHPQTQAFVEAVLKEAESDMTADGEDRLAWLRDLDAFEGEDLTLRSLVTEHFMPRGTVGLAMWSEPGEEGETPEERFVACAGYAERADDARQILDEVIDKALDDEMIEVDREDYGDATIVSVTFVHPEADEDEPIDEWEEPEMPFSSLKDEVDFTWLGDVLVVSGEKEMLEAAIDVSEGHAEALADDETLLDLLDQHPDGVEGYVYLRPELLLDAFLPLRDADSGIDFKAILDVLGITDIRAAGASFRIDTDGALVELVFSALIPEKRGLVALFDHERDGYEPPAFAGPDTAEIHSLLFDFKGVFPLAHQVIAALPEDHRGFAEQFLAPAEQQLGPLFQVMGPGVSLVTRYTTPFSADSQTPLYAIELGDELAASNILTVMGPQFGITAREFEGSQVFDAEGDAFSVGIGAGHAFFGPPEAVEDALRAAADPSGPRLASEEQFLRAAEHITGRGMYQGYADSDRAVRYSLWALEHREELSRAALAGLDDALVEEIMADQFGDEPAFLDKIPDADVILQYIGDQIWEMRSTDDGFVMRSVLLPAK